MQTIAISNPVLEVKSSSTPNSKKSNKPSLAIPSKSKIGGRKTTKPAPIVEPTDKKSLILSLMRRPGGVSLPELIQVTGWQAHSIRGLISGSLRKKLRLSVARFKSDAGVSCYRIDTVAAVDTVQQ